MEYELYELEVQLQRLGCEEASLRNRHEMALRILRRGLDPTIVWELSQDGLDELEKRLARLDQQEQQMTRNWVSNLVRKKKRHPALLFDGLCKDPLCVKMVRIVNLERELDRLKIGLKQIENQMQIVMGYEDSADQIARLVESKTLIENELRQKQEKLTALKIDHGTCR